jgi:uncharacterized protein (DUF1015 family)
LINKSDEVEFLGRPFTALRPSHDTVNEIIAPPYDVITRAEAKELAANKPFSFLRVSRAELEMDDDLDPYDEVVYERAHENLSKLKSAGKLSLEGKPCFYVYQIHNATHCQTGLALSASVRAYTQNKIRKHELTRHAKETDRTTQIETVKAMTGPVLLAHAQNEDLDNQLKKIAASRAPDYSSSLEDWIHSVWIVSEDNAIKTIYAAVNKMEKLYIADGHHRSAAAARVANSRNSQNTRTKDDAAAHNGFLAVTFPENEMLILDYNRVIKDLNNLTSEEFLMRLTPSFRVELSSSPVKPKYPKSFGMYLEGNWYVIHLNKNHRTADPVDELDVSILQQTVLNPILGISDPRTDDRIDFVGGSRGTQAISHLVDNDVMKVGFTLFPTKMKELMAVADAGLIMPPKSTWFDPKLADGLLSIPLD